MTRDASIQVENQASHTKRALAVPLQRNERIAADTIVALFTTLPCRPPKQQLQFTHRRAQSKHLDNKAS